MSENPIIFSVLLDTVSFRRKPQRTDISSLKTRFATASPTSCTPKQFAEAMAHGQTCTPAVLQGGAKAENWARQQLFCIDIDNKTAPFLTVKAALERCHAWGISPFLIYATFSHTEKIPKYRICFLCDIEITDGAQRDKIQNGFLFLFPECDISCKNRDRLFFGGKENLYTDFTATFAPLNVEFLNHAAEMEQAKKSQNRTEDGLMTFTQKQQHLTFFPMWNKIPDVHHGVSADWQQLTRVPYVDTNMTFLFIRIPILFLVLVQMVW